MFADTLIQLSVGYADRHLHLNWLTFVQAINNNCGP